MANSLLQYVDFSQPSFLISAASILFNPLFWNTAARSEYHHKTISRLFGGNAYYGCYFLASAIFTLGIVRDLLYERALRAQPEAGALTAGSGPAGAATQALAWLLLAAGNVLVASSMWALGLTGTYLGDYFGILMEGGVVTRFPFSVCASPMYYGSTMSFVGAALMYARPAGLLLAAEVLAVYLVALRFEDPFTSQIYAKRDQQRKADSEKAK